MSPYKQGRSTLKEQYLVKYSRMIYEEAIIVGFEEQQENGNADKRNATGRMKRQTLAENMCGKGTLGALVCNKADDIHLGNSNFRVATGFSNHLRQEIWNNRNKYLGQQITFKHKPHGRLNKPRSPIFHGLRGKGL
jgi:DNA ligase-1